MTSSNLPSKLRAAGYRAPGVRPVHDEAPTAYRMRQEREARNAQSEPGNGWHVVLGFSLTLLVALVVYGAGLWVAVEMGWFK